MAVPLCGERRGSAAARPVRRRLHALVQRSRR